jgi:hypothetical protein
VRPPLGCLFSVRSLAISAICSLTERIIPRAAESGGALRHDLLKQQITQVLDVIQRIVGFRVARGLLERPVYREFFAERSSALLSGRALSTRRIWRRTLPLGFIPSPFTLDCPQSVIAPIT